MLLSPEFMASLEQALRESEARFRSLTELSSDWYWEQDENFRFVAFSDGAADRAGSSPASHLGKTRWELPVVGVSDEQWAQHRAVLEAHEPFRDFEFQRLNERGEPIWMSASGVPIFGDDGRFKGYRGIGRNISARKQAEAGLARLAQFDDLTGLPNRTLLRDRLEQAIAQGQRQDWQVGALFIDLDRFKLVNDTLGHRYGDQLLEQVGNRLRGCMRASDTVARFSGDEFVVVLPDLARAQDAAAVAEKILAALAEPFDLEGEEADIGASIGIAVWPADAQDADSLLTAADAAMYRAKAAGRAGYCFFTAEMNQRSQARRRLHRDLRRALEREEFQLVYQPKVEVSSRRICGVEALLRWAHPERGMVLPGDFIPLLEETGLIVPVGEWVVRAACDQIRTWQQAGLEPVPVAVNVSARQFQMPDLDTRVIDLIAAAGVDPRLLEIEITESHLVHDPEHASRVLERLRGAGIGIAVDDFGTGYSSLAYLTRFPVSALKVDRQFVRDAPTDASDAAIVRAVIDMAHALGFVVVAEGVETEAQARFLVQHGCELAQGYFFGRPMPPQSVAALLASPAGSEPAGAARPA